MTARDFVGLVLLFFITSSGLSGCGHGGSSPGLTVDLKPTKTVALADGTDTATVRAEVEKSDGTAAPDGTSVTFSASDSSGPLASSTAVTVNGKVSFSLTHAPITGANNRTVTVTAAAGGSSASTNVKFITQPSSVDVFIAFDQAVTNLAGLQFKLDNTAGAAFDNNAQQITTINDAATGQTLAAGAFDSASNSTTVGLANGSASGLNIGTDPIIKMTFAVSTGLPQFSVDLSSAATFTATDSGGAPVAPAVTANNLVVTTTYDTER